MRGCIQAEEARGGSLQSERTRQAQNQQEQTLRSTVRCPVFQKSQAVRTWLRQHNQQGKQIGKGVRILPFLLPTQSPWLNPIEPKWVHAKRNVVEHDGLLTAKPLAERVCAYFGCSYEPHLSIPEKVA